MKNSKPHKLSMEIKRKKITLTGRIIDDAANIQSEFKGNSSSIVDQENGVESKCEKGATKDLLDGRFQELRLWRKEIQKSLKDTIVSYKEDEYKVFYDTIHDDVDSACTIPDILSLTRHKYSNDNCSNQELVNVHEDNDSCTDDDLNVSKMSIRTSIPLANQAKYLKAAISLCKTITTARINSSNILLNKRHKNHSKSTHNTKNKLQIDKTHDKLSSSSSSTSKRLPLGFKSGLKECAFTPHYSKIMAVHS